jgi:peptidase S41-like protein/tricorn protease-like protein
VRRSHAGAATVVLLAAACTNFFIGPDAELDRVGLLDQVWRDVDRHYASFVVKGVDWDSLRDAYSTRASEATSDSALAGVVGAMLSELRDFHVNLFVGSRNYRYAGFDARPAFFDPNVVAYYVNDLGAVPNGRLAFGHVAPDVGYVRIFHFSGDGFDIAIDTALARLGDVRGLIIDVRNNPGGAQLNAVTVAGRFADRARNYGFKRFRDGPAHDDLAPPEGQFVSPMGIRRFGGPVAVLTNRLSGSAAEAFVLAMRALPNVTIAGDSTAGASGTPLLRELPNGGSTSSPRRFGTTRLMFLMRKSDWCPTSGSAAALRSWLTAATPPSTRPWPCSGAPSPREYKNQTRG